MRGALDVVGPAVAIVGSRAATATGMQRAHALARHAAERGAIIVSGGALGIDGAAHRGALAGGGATIVVLASGIDVLYPARHAPMFDQVVAAGGALVSMFPTGMQPRRYSFLARNKLIAALADLAIVVEARRMSGSLVTARHAAAYGIGVAAWPGSAGCDHLIEQDGAAVIESVQDLDAALAGHPRKPAPPALDPISARVVTAMASGAHTVDDIVRSTGLSVRDVVRTLPLVRKS